MGMKEIIAKVPAHIWGGVVVILVGIALIKLTG
jgi:hypothetical protein